MAQLAVIAALEMDLEALGLETTPEWIKGLTVSQTRVRPTGNGQELYPTQEIDPRFNGEGHVSGQLRELADRYFDTDPSLCVFLCEVAERLDDAHQEWLEERLKAWRNH